MKKYVKISLSILLVIYCLGYLAARGSGLIIHRTSYSSFFDEENHRITRGDIGIPWLNPRLANTQRVAVLIYLPVMKVEELAWKLF